MLRTIDQERGVSLIEVAVALLVLSAAVAVGFRAVGQARREAQGDLPRLFAREAALNRAEELKLLGLEAGRRLPATVGHGPLVWTLELAVAAGPQGLVTATVQARADGQPGGLAVAYVESAGE
ncbi:prepilin-type N-terminal cleavage/methylation domain-containing protein [Pseudoruegeria sp. HB172150]|uniref:type IV pilus modification PilV family protein n=1 Tax=Pseudoruegeria sp. HB172150 TaxID=2721164 RepID=UPI00155478A8|nr:prepilin-type N-terminal cleavage/methylation domain-containing protein [Pseudoruegeria sp. HB172150]